MESGFLLSGIRCTVQQSFCALFTIYRIDRDVEASDEN